jgi:hypothetical protein
LAGHRNSGEGFGISVRNSASDDDYAARQQAKVMARRTENFSGMKIDLGGETVDLGSVGENAL